jgi:hypothetical protein
MIALRALGGKARGRDFSPQNPAIAQSFQRSRIR